MDDAKTVSNSLVDIYAKQMKDVAGMRTSLLSLSTSDVNTARRAIHNITVLRLYHQLARIVRYTEMIDKIEDKMYESIDNTLNDMDTFDESTWMKLSALQERLQRSMIESHKLLEPYLNFEELQSVPEDIIDADPQNSFAAMMIDQQSRDKIRTSAQALLAVLDQTEEVKDASSTSDNTD